MGTTTKLTSSSVKRFIIKPTNIPNRIEVRPYAEAVQAMEARVIAVERRLEELEARMADMRRDFFRDI